MESYKLNNLNITVDKEGANRFEKVSYPIRYGIFSEIKTPQYLFQFNLNGEIKHIRGLSQNWPHPAEWLKRTDADDWVFYSVGGYNEIFYLIGEYYLPFFQYPSNSVWEYNPFADKNIQMALAAWSQLRVDLCALLTNGLPPKIRDFLFLISRNDSNALRLKSEKFHQIIGGKVSVLPPDTRHVDYEVIPLMIADGCLYHCSFCCIKSRLHFRTRSKENIRRQIRRLQTFYGPQLCNYNSVFLGNHDALAAGNEIICMAASEAYAAFVFEKSFVKNPTLFLFGSVDSLLTAGNSLFEALNKIPFYTYINIGLESGDKATLARIRKPLEIRKIEDAFEMMLEVNRGYPNIEITANFLMGDRFPLDHYRSIIELARNRLDRFYSKGAIYLSALNTSQNKRELFRAFVEIKKLSRLPAYLYLIQRL